jgi:hypothetical protein
MARPAAAQGTSGPKYVAFVDDARVYFDNGITAYAYVNGWGAANGVHPTTHVYIDGVMRTDPFQTTERHDVCDRTAAWWGWATCNDGTKRHCDVGSATPDGITDACVGVWLLFRVTDLAPGPHRAKICVNALNLQTGQPEGACSEEREFTR